MPWHGGWEEIEFNVDSGATETVIGEKMLMSVETKEGDQRRRGVEYEVANRLNIPNEGEKEIQGVTEEGVERKVKAQVCDVNKARMSVSKIVKAGNRVEFDEDEDGVEFDDENMPADLSDDEEGDFEEDEEVEEDEEDSDEPPVTKKVKK